MDKYINNTCSCDQYMLGYHQELICLQPCEHLMHKKCYQDQKVCPFCNQNLTGFKTQEELRHLAMVEKNPQYLQSYIDLMSLQIPERSAYTSPLHVFLRNWNIGELLFSYPGMTSTWDCQRMAYLCFMNHNIYLEVKGEMKRPKDRQVVIANHSNYLDPFIIFILTGSAFIGSKKMIPPGGLVEFFTQHIPVLKIERGASNNTVEQMKEFLTHQYPRLALFPEGIITHHRTLGQFRTGAFNTGYPVQPMVIKYKPNTYTGKFSTSFTKSQSQDKLIIEVTFLDLEEPPFTPARIQEIREKMAQEGNFLLSRISNRFLKEKKVKSGDEEE